jgi:hypothetical protein
VFGELPKLFDRDFAIGYFLPLMAFFAAGFGMAAAFGLDSLFGSVTSQNPIISTTIVALLAWLAGIILLALNRDIYRLFEGYGAVNPFRLLRRFEVKRYRALESCINELTVQQRTLTTAGQSIPADDLFKRGRLMRQMAEEFPDQEHWVLPTAFGNTLRAFEVYPRVMYGLESIEGWNRLQLVIPKDFRQLVDAAKAQTDCWVNVTLLSLALLPAYVAAVLYTGRVEVAWYPMIALIVAWLSLSRARSSAVEWGELVKSAFDVYLGDLRTKSALPAGATRLEEREVWTAFSQAIIFRRSKSLPERSPAPLVEGTKPQAPKPKPPAIRVAWYCRMVSFFSSGHSQQ